MLEELNRDAKRFKRGAIIVRRRARWQDAKLSVVIGLLLLVVVLAILGTVFLPRLLGSDGGSGKKK